MEMYTMTKVGLVQTDCNKQIAFAIMMLEREMKQAYEMLRDAQEEGLDAFTPLIVTRIDAMIVQISNLNEQIKHNLSLLA